jgi:hypothetical protein
MTEKDRLDTISVVMAEIIGLCDVDASDDHPVKVSFRTLLRWHDTLETCLTGAPLSSQTCASGSTVDVKGPSHP